jgi:hypothetical protein
MRNGVREHEVNGVWYFYTLSKDGSEWVAQLCDPAGVGLGVILARGRGQRKVQNDARISLQSLDQLRQLLPVRVRRVHFSE